MAETLALEKIEQNTENLYEAIVIIARRARQINEMQRQLIERELEQNEEEGLTDEMVEGDMIEHQFLKLPKPTTVALNEMLDGKLTFEYLDKDEK
ncbi:MAG: DNA-directed RNA polymerase subunit omega [candidate division KSB1 bacterium]|nr:DNA-directed RNA polymerase subunit omega [candidate division KSB1 bacterium]